MFSLTYTSNSVGTFTKESIESLLSQARSRNFIYGITGMLLYDYGAFLQTLEGRAPDVEEIFASIRRDVRHTDIKVIDRCEIESREFASWAMAYADIRLGVSRPLGHGPGILTRLSPAAARSYLSFYRPETKATS